MMMTMTMMTTYDDNDDEEEEENDDDDDDDDDDNDDEEEEDDDDDDDDDDNDNDAICDACGLRWRKSSCSGHQPSHQWPVRISLWVGRGSGSSLSISSETCETGRSLEAQPSKAIRKCAGTRKTAKLADKFTRACH